MRKENNDSTTTEEYVKSNKAAFRRHRRDLPFGAKMQIALVFAERDKTIRRAVLLPKTKGKS